MIDRIERHIREHAGSWGTELRGSSRLRAALRANPEHDGIVRDFSAGQIGTLIFWFRPDEPKPFLVSKIVGPALTHEAIAECTALQESANRELGFSLFPKIHSVADIGGRRVVFMEAVDGPNYEIQLARAVAGPERSPRAVERVVTQLFRELGRAQAGLRKTTLSAGGVKWGTAAAGYARRFLQLCPEATAVSEAHITGMAKRIDSLSLPVHFVLTEDHVANYLPGPRAVDQLVPDIRGLCAQWPGPVSGLRILVAFFRASPIRVAFEDCSWLDALAACLVEPDKVEAVGAPVRRFLDDIGLEGSSPDLAWAFVMGVFFMRACQELDFHGGNVIATRLRGEFLEFARSAVRIDGALANRAGARDRVRIPVLNRRHLDGEFRDRDHVEFFSPRARALGEFPGWVAAALRFRADYSERHPRIFRVVRWLYRLPLVFLQSMRRSSRN